jgi:BCD family chlorophyll transporter-like MFS transporter
MVGAGMHTIQTTGLALATDIAPEEARPRVVALLYVMLLVGACASALLIGAALRDFSQIRLIQVIQSCAFLTLALNIVALWRQEVRNPHLTRPRADRPSFSQTWRTFAKGAGVRRLLAAVGLGAAAFSMQDILLEPYGAQVLGLDVSATTTLTAASALGALGGVAVAAPLLARATDAHRIAGYGALAGVAAFGLVVLSGAFGSPLLFRIGAAGIGFGSGLFSIGTLTAAMAAASSGRAGLALGAWGAVQATCSGGAILAGGLVRDLVLSVDHAGVHPGPSDLAVSYIVVFLIEIALLFAALAVIGPLARHLDLQKRDKQFGLTEFPT